MMVSTKSKQQQSSVRFEVFKDHWKQVHFIFNKSLVNDDDIQIVKNNLNQMINLLLNELNNFASVSSEGGSQNGQEQANSSTGSQSVLQLYGPVWDYLFKNNIFESLFLWCLSYPEYLYDLKYEQLKYYENLLNQMQINEQTNLLLFQQLYRPLFSLLNHCSTHNSELIENYMISILNQLCVCICKNSNLLNIFFENANMNPNLNSSNLADNYLIQNSHRRNYDQLLTGQGVDYTGQINNPAGFQQAATSNRSSNKFFIFTLLIPYIHREGCLGKIIYYI